MSTDYLFVYGTLRRSPFHPMHDLLSPAAFIGPGKFQGRLYDLGAYPGAVPSRDPADIVFGEVYRLLEPTETLLRLDHYEGCAETSIPPTEYVRAIVDVALTTGEAIKAHVYLYQRAVDDFKRIETGDFLVSSHRTVAPPITLPGEE